AALHRRGHRFSWSALLAPLALAFAFLMALAVPAAAAETINSFTSNIVLMEDGSVEVTEIIDVNVEGLEIRRGIFRDIPTVLVNPDDNARLRADLRVLSVTRDGRDEPYAIESIGAGFVRI